ncbi:MAG: tRNA uridine(34) 5-carboxymethylaminomethyl modification radical SAM/GNAT enzyme Elp3 [Halobacteriota archaeon]
MNEVIADACSEIINGILVGAITRENLQNVKIDISKRFGLSLLLSNSQIYNAADPHKRKLLQEVLQRKPVRTASGVAVIAVMTSPHPCPHGRCVPCPGGPPFDTPQSYTGLEPAAKRGIQHEYDPYKQVRARLDQLQQIGHPIDKAELIVMGGTFTARKLDYQEWFIRRCLDAMNDFPNEYTLGFQFLGSALKQNESAKIRNVGITFETRPDFSRIYHVDRMLGLGGTKVELGVQSIDDSVLQEINRGHTVAASIEANRACRDSGLKVGFHIMPGLPGSDIDSDLKMFKALFREERFCPDYLKIYLTLVTEGTKLHELWAMGKYKQIELNDGIELVASVKRMLPKWVRLQRVQRDIPANKIISGVTKGNLRQLARERLAELGGICQCIRCREIGLKYITEVDEIELNMLKYRASGGVEYFISFDGIKDDVEALIGFTRLRFPGQPHRPEIDHNTALIRELHVYGGMVNLGEEPNGQWQHRGFGSKLLRRAEEIAIDAGKDKLCVTSAVGVRQYYRRHGYELEGPYMTKSLS